MGLRTRTIAAQVANSFSNAAASQPLTQTSNVTFERVTTNTSIFTTANVATLNAVDVAVTGNLTVSGTTTYINTNNLNVGDNVVTLNADLGAVPPTENAGFEVNRGTSANVALRWYEATDEWQTTVDGTTYLKLATNTDVSTAYSNAITYSGNAALAYANAVSTAATDASTKAATAYSNAVTYAGTIAATAYSNAVAYAAANSYVNTQLGLKANLSGATFSGAVSGITTLAAGNTTITGFTNTTGTGYYGGAVTSPGFYVGNTSVYSTLTMDGGNNLALNGWNAIVYNVAGSNKAGIYPANTTFGTNTYVNATLTATGNVTFTSNTTVSALSTLKNVKLAAIANTISATAVDIYVYDTSKDSDGGAWRKRCQSTSWYNETLNTATRGSRKDFPSVAVIVATSTTVTIYDADDADLPMWMVFSLPTYASYTGNLGDTPYGIGVNGGYSGVKDIRAVRMMNGRLLIGNGSLIHALWEVNFISEQEYEFWFYPTNSTYAKRWAVAGNVSQRNSTASMQGYPNATRYGGGASTTGIITQVYNIEMGVMPNAPIDPVTKIQQTSYAVSGPMGTTVSQVDGQNRHYSLSYGAWPGIKGLAFNPVNCDFYMGLSDYNVGSVNGVVGAGSQDTVANSQPNAWPQYISGSTGWSVAYTTPPTLIKNSTITGAMAYSGSNTYNFGQGLGLTKVAESRGANSKSSALYAHIATDYNTGWQSGNTVGTWLCSTSNATLTYSNLVTDGTFNTGITGWSAYDANTTLSFTSNTLRATYSSTGIGGAQYTISGLTSGKTYYYSCSLTPSTSNQSARIQISGVGAIHTPSITNGTTAVTVYDSFVATSSSHTIQIMSYSPTNGSYLTIDNVVLQEADADRTANQFGLRVVGSITKTPVAANTDLVMYSGFNTTNYLVQDYNSAMDFGTGDFAISFWMNLTYTNATQRQTIFDRATLGGGTGSIAITREYTQYLLFTVGTSGSSVTLTSANYYPSGLHHVVCMRRGGYMFIYVDGVLDIRGSTVNTTNVSVNNALTYIGIDSTLSASAWQMRDSLLLMKVTATPPIDEQILKTYNEEKMILQAGAKSVLYGASNAVTAIAYDSATNLLHVGTSAGRSIFQGLQRIDNTTTAVSTVISAANGLVIEQ